MKKEIKKNCIYKNEDCPVCPEGKITLKKRFNICYSEVVRFSVNELIPFEQIGPFKRLASILDNKCHDFIEEKIDFFAQHCKDKKSQHKCSACVVLGDLKLKLLE